MDTITVNYYLHDYYDTNRFDCLEFEHTDKSSQSNCYFGKANWPSWEYGRNKTKKADLTDDMKRELTNSFLVFLLRFFIKNNYENIIIGENDNRTKRKDYEPAKILTTINGKEKLNGVVGAISGKIKITTNQIEGKTLFEELKTIIAKKRLLDYQRDQNSMDKSFEFFKDKVDEDYDNSNISGNKGDFDLNKAFFNNFDFNVNLVVKSRFDGEKPFFAATMLKYGMGGGINELLDNWDEDGLLDFLLINVFASNLRLAIEKGIYRKYQYFEGNDDKVKGSIDIARHIRLNVGKDNGKISYKYRENSPNNSFNALIVFTYEYAKQKYPSIVANCFKGDMDDFIKQLKHIVSMDLYPKNTILKDNIKPISHPYYGDYEKVREVCLKILRDEGVSVFESNTNNDSIQGCLFYLPDLWEKYLENKVFVDCFKDSSFTVESQDDYSTHYIQQNYNNSYFFTGYPDFVVKNEEGQNIVVLDAKEKPGWVNALTNDVLSYDYDVTKCLRDMVVCGADSTGVVFPVNDNKFKGGYDSVQIKRKISNDANDSYRFLIVPLFIAIAEDGETYDHWNEKMQESINNLKNALLAAGIIVKRSNETANP